MNRSTPPPLNPIVLSGTLLPKTYRLDNGIEVYELSGGSTAMVKIDLLLQAGARYQPIPLCALAANRLLTDGTATRSSAQISEKIDYHGAYLQGSADKDHAALTLLTPLRHLEALLPLFAEVIAEPVFPADELEIFRERQRQRFLIDQQKVKVLAHAGFSEAMFGPGHPYGYRLLLSDFSQLTRKHLVQFHQQHYMKGGWRLVVSGQTDSSVSALLNRTLGSISFGHLQWNEKEFSAGSISGSTGFVPRDEAVQSALRLGLIVPGRSHPDYIGLTVLNTLLGGYFGSRLMQNLREEKGYTYGIQSAIVSLVKCSYLVILSEVGSEVTRPALDEILREISRLSDQEVEEEELRRVKSQMEAEMIRSLDGPFAKADFLASLLDHNLPLSSVETAITEIRSVTPQRLRQLAETYLSPSAFTRIVAGPSSANPGFPLLFEPLSQ
ncbi:MAG: M16 family metallopeptidase [Bacteroidales bacterium]